MISPPKTLIVPKAFFQTHRRSGYTNWRFAYWRELFQNSTDAGANRFDITMTEIDAVGTFGRSPPPHKVLRVTFADNGHGMTRDVLENVFFALGRTTKTGDDGMTGGFGTARIMFCCSQDRCEIHTGGMRVEADGAEYAIEEVSRDHPDHVRNGCRFVIDIDLSAGEQPIPDQDTMTHELIRYLSMSQIPGTVMLNGEEMKHRALRGKVRRYLHAKGEIGGFASVHLSASDDEHQGTVIVRQRGSAMYARRLYGLKQRVIVEIDPHRAREILTENRGSMHDAYSDVLDEMVNALIVDTRTAMSDKKTGQVIDYAGSLGKIRISRRMKRRVLSHGGEIDYSGDVPPHERANDEWSGIARANAEPATVRRETPRLGIPDIRVKIDDLRGHPKLSSSVSRYMPTSWGAMNPDNGRNGIKPHKLLFAWATACRSAVENLHQMIKSQDLDAVIVIPGFYFTKPEENYEDGEYKTILTRAICQKIDKTSYALLINPLDMSGRCRFALSSFSDPRPDDPDAPVGMRRMIGLAAHEVAHIVSPRHDQRYASTLTGIVERLDQREVWLAMQKAMAMVPGYYPSPEAADTVESEAEPTVNTRILEMQSDCFVGA